MKHSGSKGNPAQAFTLLELLIVIGIVMILSAIAVENYLAASVRAKTSRVKADFATLALAIETYTADHNAPPRMASHKFYHDPEFDLYQGIALSGTVSKALSTPVAYLAQAFLFDPFLASDKTAPLDERLYTYQDIPAYLTHDAASEFWPRAAAFYGPWRLGSVGPDKLFYHGFANSGQLPYDPTNGLISLGNVWRSPKYATTDGGLPPIPGLLGEH